MEQDQFLGQPYRRMDTIESFSAAHSSTSKSVDTAHSVDSKTANSICSTIISYARRCLNFCFQPVKRCCTIQSSILPLFGLFQMIIQVLICIVFIINWHTETYGAIEIGLDYVEILIIIYMIFGIIGMIVAFRKRNDARFVIFVKSEKQASKYLISGVYAFGAGSIFMSVILLFTYAHCKEHNYRIIFSTIRLLFTMLQMLFLQRFYLATFKQNLLLVCLLFHIMATNFCVWILYLTEETKLYTHTSEDKLHEKCQNENNVTRISNDLREYLIPFTMEFCLICAGIIYSIASSMKYFKDHRKILAVSVCVSNGPTAYTALEEDFSTASNIILLDSKSSSRQVMVGQVKPYSGSYPGFLAGVAVSVIMIVSALVIEQKDSLYYSVVFHLSFFSIVSVSQFISIMVVRYSLRQHEYTSRMLRSDDVLLIISLSGLMLFELLCMIAAVGEMNVQNHQTETVQDHQTETEAVVIFVHSVANFVTALTQSVVIIQCLRFENRLQSLKTHMVLKTCKMETLSQRLSQALIYLVVINTGFWVVDSLFEIKSHGNLYYPVGDKFYKRTWQFWSSLLYPFGIFFRFHSATLLFEILTKFQHIGKKKASEELRRKSLSSIDTNFSWFKENPKDKQKSVDVKLISKKSIHKDDIYGKHQVNRKKK